MLALFAASWVITAWLSFAFWWTRDFDFTTKQLPLMLFCSLIGPAAFLVGWTIHGKGVVLLKSRAKP